MQRLLVLGFIVLVLIVILYACNFGGNTPAAPEAGLLAEASALQLAVQPQSGQFNTVGQPIAYQYFVANSASTPIPGPVTITSDKMAVTCPEVSTIGNTDANLDVGETLTCSGTYALTQNDVNAGQAVSTAVARAGNINSNTVSTTVPVTLAKVLELVVVANPTTYNQANQVITFNYTVKNNGATALGPAQFVVHNDRLGNINCGGADTTITPGATLTCTSGYTTSENDRAVGQLNFNMTVSGGGATLNQPVGVVVENKAPNGTSTQYTQGTTISHHVNNGEWMIQIARCYGADFKAVRNANPQVIDPDWIWPVDTLTIPNIGSNGKIYGPPCVTYYTAQAGDTWNTIAQKYNADLAVLMEANKGLSVVSGVKLKIPNNSAGGNPIPGGNEPIRINFPAGSNSVTLSGTVHASRVKERYVFAGTAGQSLSVKVNSPGTELNLAVTAASGTVLKPQDGNLTFAGTIPTNGDYYIDIINVAGVDKVYQLEITLVTPAAVLTERVADINQGAGDSSPAYLAVFNGVLYFSATGNDNAGAELWKYDVATNTASRVADIFIGPDGSNPAFLTEYKGALYFSANGNDGAGVELWRYNGSAVGRLGDINPGTESSNPSYMTVYKDRLYFSARSNDGMGVELWQTDGTNTTRVLDIYQGSGDSNPAYLEVFGDVLYFSATSNDGFGTELWKYDGTNVARVSDINPNVGNANPAFLTVYNNILYFSANANDNTGTELWKYDGTTASRAADINAGPGDSIPSYLTVFNGALYFSANGNNGKGFELWKFDGTTPSLVSDINLNGDSFPAFLAEFSNQLYFQANGGGGAGKELWKFRGP